GLQRLESDAHHGEGSANGERVLRHLIAANVRELRNGQRAELHGAGCSSWIYCVAVINTCSSRTEQVQVSINRVLIQRNQQVDAMAFVGDFIRPCGNGEKGWPAANDGLIGVVGVQVEAAATEDFREHVSWCSHTLTGSSPYTNGEGLLHD